ncbi:flagellar biosynthesis protein FlhF [Aestuariibacter salexigens]|uniref:flagellar biosynthesis protein FlhF n=1 Tax=Aestuariibacter salexigens TaxID=226010 RepID=UPI0004216DD2|nr:flagellar biosynthesis protein FlhF [Aestuariibacter salexigens]
MKIRRFYGKDMREALRLVREELGSEAVIMSTKKLKDGLELVAAYDRDTVPQKSDVAESKNRATPTSTPTLSEIIGDDGPDSLKALLEQQAAANAKSNSEQEQPKAPSPKMRPEQAAKSAQNVSEDSRQRPSSEQTYTQAADRNTSTPANPYFDAPQPRQKSDTVTASTTLEELKDEISSLRNVLQFQVSGLLEQDKRRRHPLHGYLSDRLQDMGITRSLAEQIVTFAPESADERRAWLFILKLLANRLRIDSQDMLSSKGVVALLGATGSGKTTTAAKLAARYAQKYGADQVALVTIDGYRIAAYEQLATYARIIGCSVKKAQHADELADALYHLRHKRMVIIDSAGFSQRDERLVRQLDNIDQLAGSAISKYVLMPATAQHKVLHQTLHAYKNVQLSGCILTKLDECYSLGEALSVVIDKGLPVGYITNGQKVPEDLRRADAKFLVSTAAKLYKKYGLAHTTTQHEVNSALAV